MRPHNESISPKKSMKDFKMEKITGYPVNRILILSLSIPFVETEAVKVVVFDYFWLAENDFYL